MKWMPIDTAPMDGTWILLSGYKYGKDMCVSHWYVVAQWEPFSQRKPELGGRWLYGRSNSQYVRDPKIWTYLPALPDKDVSRETQES